MIRQKISILLFISLFLSNYTHGIESTSPSRKSFSRHEDSFSHAFMKAEKIIQQPTYQIIKWASSLALGTAFWFELSFFLGIIKFTQFYRCAPSQANPEPTIIDRAVKKGFFYNKGVIFTALPSLVCIRYFLKRIQEWQLAQEEQKIVKEFLDNKTINYLNIPKKLKIFLSDIREQYQKNSKDIDLAQVTRIVKAFLVIQEEKLHNNSLGSAPLSKV